MTPARVVRQLSNVATKVRAGDRRGAVVAGVALVLTLLPVIGAFLVPGAGAWLGGMVAAFGGAEAAAQLTVEAVGAAWVLIGVMGTAIAPALARHRAAYAAPDDLKDDDIIDLDGRGFTVAELRRLLEDR